MTSIFHMHTNCQRIFLEISILQPTSQILSCFSAETCLRIQLKRIEFQTLPVRRATHSETKQTITKVTTNYHVYIQRIACEWFLNCVYGCNTTPGLVFFSQLVFAKSLPGEQFSSVCSTWWNSVIFSLCVFFSSVFSSLRSH